MQKTLIRGNDAGSILVSAAVLVLLAGMLLVTLNMYVIAYSAYATREEQKFILEITNTGNKTEK